ncbi:MAG: hypothetical protein QG565_338, partial [Campylobacterota bacterium]|nr:hypothetical protein [Campylobacterota bacterium]
MKSHTVEQNHLLKTYKYILDFYFGNVSFDTILSLSPTKNEDFSVESLLGVSEQIGLVALEKTIAASNIANHLLPCIVFNNRNEPFVYLKNIANKKIELYDALEEKSFEIEHKELGGYKKALFIFREESKVDSIDKIATNKWFWEPVKSFWRSYVEVGFLTFFINLFALFVPLYIMIVYDRVVPNEAYDTLFVLSFGLIIALIFELVFKSVRSHIIDKTGKKLSLYLEEDLMKRLLGIQSQYDIMMTGSKVNLFRELATVRDFFATKSVIQIIDFPFFIFALIAIYFISPAVALVPFALALFIMLINIGLQIPIGHLSKRHLENT